MSYLLSASIAYRYAKSRKANQTSFVSFINRFSVAGIALGLMALIIVVSVMNGLEGQLKQRILGIVPHIEITSDAKSDIKETITQAHIHAKTNTKTNTKANTKTPTLSETPVSETPTQNSSQAVKEAITETPMQPVADAGEIFDTSTPSLLDLINGYLSKTPMQEVLAVMAYRETEAVVQSRKDLRGVQLHGIQPLGMKQHTMVANNMEQGRFSDLESGSFRVIVGRALALKLDVRVGDRVRVMVAGASVYTPFGRMPSQRLVTVSGIFDMGSQMDDKVLYMNIDDVNRLVRDPKAKGESVRLFLNDAFNYLAIVNTLKAELGVRASHIKTWRERQGPLFDAVKMEKNMMMLMLLLIIAVAAFNIISALVMVVSEKKGDIAVLQTQGMTPKTIMLIFILNGLFNGVKGAGIGLILGCLVTSQLNNILELVNSPLALAADGSGLPIEMDISQIASITLFSMLLCIAASIYPAYKAMQIQPSQALQNE